MLWTHNSSGKRVHEAPSTAPHQLSVRLSPQTDYRLCKALLVCAMSDALHGLERAHGETDIDHDRNREHCTQLQQFLSRHAAEAELCVVDRSSGELSTMCCATKTLVLQQQKIQHKIRFIYRCLQSAVWRTLPTTCCLIKRTLN